MASALASLHGQGMAHMDVKPDNIMLGEDGQYKLGDFGLACRLAGPEAGATFSEGDCRWVVLNSGFGPRSPKITRTKAGPKAERLRPGLPPSSILGTRVSLLFSLSAELP